MSCAITGLEFDDGLCSPVDYNGELVCAWVKRAIDNSDRDEFIRILSRFRKVKTTEIQIDIIEILSPELLPDQCKILYALALWIQSRFWLRGMTIIFETVKDKFVFDPGSGVTRFVSIHNGVLKYGIVSLSCLSIVQLSDPQAIEKTQKAIEDDVQGVNRPLKDIL